MRLLNPRLVRLLMSRSELVGLSGAAVASAMYGASVVRAEPTSPWNHHVRKLTEGIGDGATEAAAVLAEVTADPHYKSTDGDKAVAATRAAVGAAGAIPPLISLLKAGTAEGKTVAAAALRNLSKSEANHTPILRDGGLAPLVALLQPEAADGMQQATQASVQALGHLASDDASKAAIANAGGIAPLVKLVKSGSPWVRARAAGVLQKLATTAENKVAIANAGGVPALVVLALEGTREGKARAAGCLWRLARHDDTRSLITKFGGVPALIALVREGGSALERDRAAAALENLAHNPEAAAKMQSFGYVVD